MPAVLLTLKKIMTETLLYKAFAAVLILAGVVLVANPELLSNKPVPEDIFRAVERRVWWGLFIGAGSLMLFHHALKPWLLSYVAVSVAMTFGLLVARLIGIGLDGSVPKQWLWVAVEVVVLLLLLAWYAKIRR